MKKFWFDAYEYQYIESIEIIFDMTFFSNIDDISILIPALAVS